MRPWPSRVRDYTRAVRSDLEVVPLPELSDPPGVDGRPSKRDGENLTRRAALTLVSGVLRQGSLFLVGLAVLPVVIHGLGVELYGAWAVIQQTAGYIALADARSMATVKFTLATRQHSPDIEEKRRQVGAAIVVWFLSLPLLTLAGGLAVWGIPRLIETSDPHVVQVAMAIVVVAMALERLTSLPRHVLRAMNLDYRAMGLDAAAVVLGGVLAAVAIWLDLGLPGVAAATFGGTLLGNGIRFFVARRALPWFGPSRPSRAEVRTFAGLTGWLVFGELTGLLLDGGAVVLAGFFLGPTAAALYAATTIVPRMALGPLGEILGASGPGLYGLCGRREWDRVIRVRNEQQSLALGLLSLFAPVTIALNGSFVSLWVGARYFAGHTVTLYLLLATVCVAIATTDQTIADATFAFRQRAFASLAGGVVLIGVAIVGHEAWGLPAVALGLLLGRVLVVSYGFWLVARRVGGRPTGLIAPIVRPLTCLLALCGVAFAFATHVELRSWVLLVGAGGLWVVGSLAFYWIVGMNRDQRKGLLTRVRSLSPRPGGGQQPDGLVEPTRSMAGTV
jgi:O-antigen/teichoic acid export membrane protein